MRNLIEKAVLVTILIIAFSSCESKSKIDRGISDNTSKKIETSIAKPSSLVIHKDSLKTKMQEKATDKIVNIKDKMIPEALQAIVETQNAVGFLTNNKKEEARKQLVNTLGKLDIIMEREPDLELLPIDVNIEVNDLITDISSIKQITKDAEKALKNEHLQDARALLSGLSSEIQITTVNIPLLTYPMAIKRAVKFLDEGKLKEAEVVLMTELNELVIEDDFLPIPVLQAEVMLDEALVKHEENAKENKVVVINLLDNAEYQLKLAEALGYGKKNVTYKELNKDIKNLKKSVNSDTDSKGLFKKLKLKLKKFKERLF